MQLTSSISSENLMQSRLGELGLQSIDVGGQVNVSLDLYHINYMAVATIICVDVLLGETKNFASFMSMIVSYVSISLHRRAGKGARGYLYLCNPMSPWAQVSST